MDRSEMTSFIDDEILENEILASEGPGSFYSPARGDEDSDRLSSSLPTPHSPPNKEDMNQAAGTSVSAFQQSSGFRGFPAYPVVHGFNAAPVPGNSTRQQAMQQLRRTGSTGRVIPQHPVPLAPVRPISADRSRKAVPAALAGNLSRHKDRFVPLSAHQQHIPEESAEDLIMSTEDESEGGAVVSTGDIMGKPRRNWGRITVYCIAESFCREQVEEEVEAQHQGADYRMYPEAIYLQTSFSANGTPGDVFIMDYGVAICWNLEPEQEKGVVDKLLKPCMLKPMPTEEITTEQLLFHYSAHEPPHIQNDIITINKRQAADHQVKLAISHALAQSSKLTVYEERIGQLVEEVRYLPEALAKYGEVRMSRRQVAKLMGKVFLQKSAVNLLSTVLDTPEYFWRAPDNLQVLYNKVCEYLELDERVELVNARFEIIQKMLNIWSEHSQRTHISRLDAIIVLLVLIEVVMAAFQVVGMLKSHLGK